MAAKVYNPEYPGLYYFDTFTFTTLGTSGHRGPDPTKGYANAPWRDGDFSIVNGQQRWTVPATGTYRVEAAGAYGATPGRVVSGDVDLYEGQTLTMLVGQQPTQLALNFVDTLTVGGGGGTFVVSEGTPLIVASGGDGTVGQAGSFSPYGSGNGINGAGYFSNGSVTSETFQFLKPTGYIDGGFGNICVRTVIPEEGGFGGGQSPVKFETSNVSVTGNVLVCSNVSVTGNILTTTNVIAVGNIIMMSPDGSVDWTQTGPGPEGDLGWSDVVWSGTQFVVVGYSGVMTSPDGVTWTTQTTVDPSSHWYSIAWSGELFVAGGGDGGSSTIYSIMTSPDGITWTNQPAPNPVDVWLGIAWSGTLFVAVSDNGGVATSPDGITWTQRATASPYTSWYAVTWSEERSLFVAVGGYGGVNNDVMTSPDGIAWTNRTYPLPSGVPWYLWYAVTYGNGIFVAVGRPDGVMTSPDGITWTNRTSIDETSEWTSVVWSETEAQFIAVAGGGSSRVMTSPDGITWTARTFPSGGFFTSVALQTNNVFGTSNVLVCNNVLVTSNVVVFASSNVSGGGGYTGSPGDGVSGATCYADPAVTNFTDLGASKNNAGYVIVTLMDPAPVKQGVTINPWAIQPTAFAPTTTWSAMAYGNGVYVSVSNNGTFPVMYSPNGLDWFTTTTGAPVAPWTSVTFGNGTFVAVTQRNVMYSLNGINWKSINNTTGYTYFSTNISELNSIVTNSDGSVVVASSYNIDEPIEVYKNGSLLYTLPEYDNYYGATNYDGTVVSVKGNVYTNGTLTHSYGYIPYYNYFYSTDMNADGTMFVFDTGLGYVSVYETVNLLYSIPVDYYYFMGVFMNSDGTIVTICNYNEIITYINGILTYTTEYYDRTYEDPEYFAVSKDGTTTVVNSYTFELGYFTRTLLVYKNGVRIHKIILKRRVGVGPLCINYDGTVFTCGYQRYVNGIVQYTEPTPPSYGYSEPIFALSWDAKVSLNGLTYLDNARVYQYNQLTPVAYWKSVTYGNKLFVSLATGGESMYSTDASSWVYGNTVSVSSLTSSTYGNDKFVAVGTSNVVYSLDGYIWSNVTTGTTSNSWTSVSYGEGRFMTVSSNATSMYSLNGIDWTTGGSTGVSSNCLAYGAGYFVCLSRNSENSTVSVSTDGQTWQTTPLTYAGADYSGITYGDQGFLAVSSTGLLLGFIPTFWVNPTRTNNSTKLNSRNWSGLAYGNGSFVAVGQGLIQTTQDYGNTWSAFTVNNILASVTYSSDIGTFLALPSFFGDGVYTSTDGLTWNLSQTLPSIPSTQTSLTYGDGKFVALLDGVSNVFYSRDGINWNVTASNVGASWSVAYGNQTFAAVSNCITSYSSDAINWTSEDHTAPDYLFYGGVGEGFAMSSDGSVVCSNGTVYINGVFAYYLPCDGGVAMNSDGSIIAVGFSGTICVYKNGILDYTIDRYAMKLGMNSDGTIIVGSDSYYEVQIYTNGILSYTLPTTQSSFGLNGDGTIVATHYQFDTLHVYKNGNFLYAIPTEGSGGIDGSIIKLSSDGTILAHSTDNGAVDVSVFKYSTLLYKINSETIAPRFAMSSDGSLILVGQFYYSGNNLGPIMYRNGAFMYQIQVPNEEYYGCYAMSSDGSIVGWNRYVGDARVYKGFLFYQWSSLTYGNGVFVAVANPGGSMYSSDGINWLVGNAPLDKWTSVSYGDGFFVAVSDDGTYPVMYSQDGINWSTTDPGSQLNNWGSVAFGGDTFLAIPTSGATTMTTTVSKTF